MRPRDLPRSADDVRGLPRLRARFRPRPAGLLHRGDVRQLRAWRFPLIALLTLIEHLLIPSWSLFRLVLLAWAICVPLIPWIWQYSRAIWIHFDQWVDPMDDDSRGTASDTEEPRRDDTN